MEQARLYTEIELEEIVAEAIAYIDGGHHYDRWREALAAAKRAFEENRKPAIDRYVGSAID